MILLVLVVAVAVVWLCYKILKGWNQTQQKVHEIAASKLIALAPVVSGKVEAHKESGILKSAQGDKVAGTWEGDPVSAFSLMVSEPSSDGRPHHVTYWRVELRLAPGGHDWKLVQEQAGWKVQCHDSAMRERAERELPALSPLLVSGAIAYVAKDAKLQFDVPIASGADVPEPAKFTAQLRALTAAKSIFASLPV